MIETQEKSGYEIIIDLKTIMKKRNISINQLSKITGIRYHIVKKYYCNDVCRIDLYNLGKFCNALNCHPTDIIKKKQI